MNKNIYILLLILIVEIYSADPAKVCYEDDETTVKDCQQSDCTGDQTLLLKPTGADNKHCYTPRDHCQTYHATNDECAGCESSNYKLEGDPKVCDTCNTGYTRVPASGNPFKCYTNVDNCEEYNPSYDACYKCPEGKVLSSDNTKCVTKINGCKDHSNTDGTCATCYTGSTGTTTSTSTCACADGTFDDENKICKKIANCVDYDGNAKCTKCQNGYKLDSNPGNTCTQCNPTTNTNNGGTEACFAPRDNCAQHANDGKCAKCNTGYYVTSAGACDDTCASGVKGGSYCHSAGFTLVENCIEYNGVDDNSCIKCGNYIAIASGATTGEECKTGGKECYYPQISDGENCYTPIAECEEYDKTIPTNYKCKLCKSGFYTLIDGTCVKMSTDENKDKPSETTEAANNASSVKLNVLFVVLLLSIFW